MFVFCTTSEIDRCLMVFDLLWGFSNCLGFTHMLNDFQHHDSSQIDGQIATGRLIRMCVARECETSP